MKISLALDRANPIRHAKYALSAVTFALSLLASASAFGQLTIVPTFDSTITSDPDSAQIISTINTAIQYYESTFTDRITVTIKFQEITTGLGQSNWWYYNIAYSTFRAALAADASSPDDFTALASLPTGTLNPVTGTSFIALKTANIRALGIPGTFTTGLAGGVDGIIGLNTSISNLTRTSPNPSKYDLLAVTEHEIDEILGMSSGLDFSTASPPILPEDLFRYDSGGHRTFTTSGDNAYFSIDGGAHLLARFSQNASGDHADWWSLGAHTPEVQDAFATPGAMPNMGVETRVLDAIGYNLAAASVPEPSALGLVGAAALLVLCARRRRS